MKIPQNVNFLERGIRALVDSDDKAYRLRVMMANVVVGQFLRDGVKRDFFGARAQLIENRLG